MSIKCLECGVIGDHAEGCSNAATGGMLWPTAYQEPDAELAALRTRLAAVEVERDVISGVACAEEQARGDGPCGARRSCARAERDTAIKQRDILHEANHSLAEAHFRSEADLDKALALLRDAWLALVGPGVEPAQMLAVMTENRADTSSTVYRLAEHLVLHSESRPVPGTSEAT